MRAYGIDRNDDFANPDKADIQMYGIKGFKIKNRREKRRFWKKMERKNARNNIRQELEDMD